jgi:hypothetical protein
VHRAAMEVYCGRSLARWSPSNLVVADAASGCQAFDGRYDPCWGAKGMRTRGHRGRTVPQGLGRTSAATPSAVLLTRPVGHKPLGAGWPAPQQPVRSPAKKLRLDRCGAATLNPAPAPTHQWCPIRRFLTEEPWPLGSTSSVARPRRRLGPHLHRGVLRPGGGRGCLPPGPQSGPCCAGSPARGPMGCPGGAG